MSKSRPLLALLLAIGILPLLLNGLYNSYLSQTPHIYWTAEILTWVVLPAVLLGVAFHRKLFSTTDIGLHIRIFGRSSWPLFLAATVVISVLVVAIYGYSTEAAHKLFSTNHGAGSFFYRDVVPGSGLLRFLVLVYLCLSAGIVEELYFRGMTRLLFSKNWSGSLLYIATTAIVFSLIHWEGGVWNLTEAFLFGLATSALYVVSGNLWPLIIGHALTDYFWFS